MAIGGLSSGDFRLSNSALRILYSVIKDTIPSLAADALTQSNPVVSAGVSDAWPTTAGGALNVKKGVLGGMVAFLRPDVGNNVVGGAVLSAPSAGVCRPLGLFIVDAVGNAYENTPAIASGKDAVLRGGSVGVKLYETKWIGTGDDQGIAGAQAAGTAISYHAGERLYGSCNGLLTNQWQDSLEAYHIGSAAVETDCTRVGVVISGPDSSVAELFVALFL